MNVLSLFDGMGCGWIALKELGVTVEKGYASETDKFAIAQTKLNFPDVIHLGDVNNWQKWDIHWSSIDLVMAGSPCQGFSFAGKGLAFDDPRSKLFFVFVDILNACKMFNPDVKFLLENVDMKKEYRRIISEYVGLFPVLINSALVSAQNRERWYWSNIRTKQVGLFGEIHTDIPQPKDRGIFLKDILQPESEIAKKYYMSNDAKKYLLRETINQRFIQSDAKDKGGCVTANYHKGIPYNVLSLSKYHEKNLKETDDKANSLLATSNKGAQANGMTLVAIDLKTAGGKSKTRRGGISEEKCQTLDTLCYNGVFNGSHLRRLTPTECARLQTIPDWYDWGKTSDSQIYKMLGNGWTCEVIKHILSFML